MPPQPGRRPRAQGASLGQVASAWDGTEVGPDPVQLLTPAGRRVKHPSFAADVTLEEVRGFYRDLVLARRLDTEATALQRQGELGLWPPALGQEAAQIGSGRALTSADHAFPTYREHGVALTRGVDALELLRMFRGVDHGGWDPVATGFHLYTIVIGAQTLHATGYAMGLQRDGRVGDDGSAVLAYLGDGATSQGAVSEAFVWAAAMNAPIVFFCQNNGWAISEPTSKQTRIPIYQRARGFGFPGVRVDGNDVLGVLAVTRAALAHAREGGGPVLVEAVTYRMGAHTTSDDPSRYRDPDEVAAWRARDPIDRVRALLEREDAAFAGLAAAVEREAEELAERVRSGVRSMPDPAPLDIYDDVYAEPHAALERERAEHAAYLASFEEVS
ncbi:pyruvate dehydrogenase (acetyl-transferring) E1 component subunit alpha [Motilibacter sp. E257]|uniref:Pyruvate dehydrogenase (Acetyl-transferring) E1 component subunit alpha n=1 Tax=Motilibacter deserti TaxID=2714956 RepID=A0ABX0GXT5_9ACTN|nr:pyruvate dehydrogenase (acetyl-transferring) E1 component subunit alpha [Motilibacter deserti]